MGKVIRNLVIVAVVWVVIAVVATTFVHDPAVVPAVAAAAALSLILYLWSMLQKWEGTIERLEMRRVKQTYKQGNQQRTRYVDQLMADVRLSNGKLKTMPGVGSWRVGDRLAKRVGDTSPQYIPRQA
jgi:hypothetical protein